jgi:hypothetical protein
MHICAWIKNTKVYPADMKGRNFLEDLNIYRKIIPTQSLRNRVV